MTGPRLQGRERGLWTWSPLSQTHCPAHRYVLGAAVGDVGLGAGLMRMQPTHPPEFCHHILKHCCPWASRAVRCRLDAVVLPFTCMCTAVQP